MAAIHLLLLGILCLGATAIPYNQRKIKNTIFLDEQLEGEIFENLRKFDDIAATDTVSNVYRLPTTTRPKHYDIFWKVDTHPDVLAFSGTVDISLYATQPNVSNIVIHSNELSILSVTLTKNGNNVRQTSYLQPEYHFLHVQLLDEYLEYNANANDEELYVLTIAFEAPLRNDMYGIYRNWYRNNHTEEVSYMASTQFQSTAARSAFPCYDEPSFKADFDVVIARRSDVKSWSCTRQQYTRNSTLGDAFEEDVYYTTPVMSTYLLALIVADYDSHPIFNDNNEIMHEVIARPGAMESFQYEYADDMGQRLLDRMNVHTNIDFHSVTTGLKMTQAAIPDFGAGAMENWGLLTYREAYLMYDGNHTNSNSKQLIAYILSHEIAHMWFGNLVTCDWWDVLWLNEGFARYYQYFLTDWVDPLLGLGIRFVNEQVHSALLSDSAANAHPLSHSGVGSPGAVSAMFSTLSYNKGAAVIRMTEHLLGFNVHEQGLRNYLQNRRFQTALPIHLFQELQDVAVATGAISEYGPDFSVIDYYRSWTDQAGHPVLNVEVNHQTGQMIITQRRFDINTGYGASANWIIPITFTTESTINFNDTKPTHIISEGLTIINRGTVGDEWVIFNIQQTGYYRVNYDDYTWNLIALALRGEQRTAIHEYNKAQIVNDVFQFARSGLMTYTRAFDILSFLQYETDYPPWAAAMTGFTWLRTRFASSPYLAELHGLIERWATNVMNELTYEPRDGETFMDSYLRMQIAPVMCQMEVEACRISAMRQFEELYNSSISDSELVEVPNDSRSWVYCNALRDGPPEYFDYLWQRFLEHNVYNEKIVILGALGCTPHEDRLFRFLDAIMSDTYEIRPQDYNTAFNSALNSNENNTQIVFRYVRENLEKVEAAYNVTSSLGSPLSAISSRLRTPEEIDEFQLWARENRNALGSAYNAAYNGAESTRQSLQWLAENEDDVLHYIQDYESNISTSVAPDTTIVDVVTVTPPTLQEPSTPQLAERDSAITTVLSLTVVGIAALVNLAL